VLDLASCRMLPESLQRARAVETAKPVVDLAARVPLKWV